MKRPSSCLALALCLACLGSRPDPAFGLGGGAAVPAGEARSFALRAGRVYTVSGGVLEPGTIVVRAGKIVAAGEGIPVPADVPLYDLPGHVVIPALLDAETSLARERADVQKSLSPEVLAADGWDFFADRRDLLRGGVATVYVAPGVSAAEAGAARLVSGRGCVVKVAGSDPDPLSRLLLPATGVQVTLGELPKRPPSLYDPPIAASPDHPFEVLPLQLPQSRPGAFLALRGMFAEARNYERALALAGFERAAALRPSPEAAALLPLLAHRDYLRVRANRARDILHVLEFVERLGVNVVLEGGREAELLASRLRAAGVPVVFSGGFRPGVIAREDLASETFEGRYREESLIALERAGVKVVLHSPTDAEVKDLLLVAADAVRAGLEPAAALRAITLAAAEVLGVADRVGSIEAGKDADLVVLGGDPFTPAGKPLAVFVNGELVFHDGPTTVAAGTPGGAPGAAAAPVVIIRCRKLFTGRGEEHAGGVVIVEGKKIRYAGPGILTAMLARRDGVRVIDAGRYAVVPGFIDASSSAGARAEALALQRSAGSGAQGASGRSAFRLADAIDPADPELRSLLRAGITTVLLAPEPAGPIAGQVTAWKLSARSRAEVTLKEYAALLVRNDLPAQELKKMKEYHERWKAHEAKTPPAGEAPERQDAYEPLRPLFERKLPVVVFAAANPQLLDAVRLFAKENGMRVIATGPARLDQAAADLRREGAEAILSVPFLVEDPESLKEVNVPAAAARAGLAFAVSSRAAGGAAELVPQVALAVERGLSPREALEAMTVRAAEMFGLEERVGSLEEGKDADLVFIAGEPLSLASRVAGVMVDGEIVFLEGQW